MTNPTNADLVALLERTALECWRDIRLCSEIEKALSQLRSGAVVLVPEEPTEKELIAAHMEGMKNGELWAEFSHQLSLRVARQYLPAARRAMLACAKEK